MFQKINNLSIFLNIILVVHTFILFIFLNYLDLSIIIKFEIYL